MLMADHGMICSMSRSGNVWDKDVHMAFFAKRAGFDDAMLQSLAHGSADDPCCA